MCTNANKTAASLMLVIEPTLKSLLTFTNLITTPEGQLVMDEYDAALTAVQNWKSGTPAQVVLEIIGDFQLGFNKLPLLPSVKTLTNIILAGVETVIGILTANSSAPAGPAEVLAPEDIPSKEEAHAMHQAHTIIETTAKVKVLVPSFKRSIWHSPATQYNRAWDQAAEAGNFPPALRTNKLPVLAPLGVPDPKPTTPAPQPATKAAEPVAVQLPAEAAAKV